MISDPLAVFLALAAIAFFAIWLEVRFRFAQILCAVLLAIVLAAVAANLRLIPAASPVYDMLGGVGVSLGIALILLGVDIRTVLSAGPRMLAAFGLGAAGTIVGSVVGTALLHDALGPETYKLAGQYTGTYIGGSVNFVAVGRGLGTRAEVFTAAVAADNVTTTLWMIVCFALPGVASRWWMGPVAGAAGRADAVPTGVAAEAPVARQDVDPAGAAHSPAPAASAGANVFISSLRTVTIRDTAALILLAVGAVWMAGRLAARIPEVPQVLWLTTLVLVVAQFGVVRRLAGGPLSGNYLLQLFLATIGAQSIIAEIVRVGPAVFWFTLIVVGVHGILLFGAGRLAGLDLPTLASHRRRTSVGRRRPWPSPARGATRTGSSRASLWGLPGMPSATTQGSPWRR